MNVFLFENPDLKNDFLPLTFTRSIADLRLGIFDFKERWKWLTNTAPLLLHEDTKIDAEDLLISAHVVVNKKFIEEAQNLSLNSSLWLGGKLLAKKGSLIVSETENKKQFDITYLESIWDLTEKNADVLKSDIELQKKRHYSKEVSEKNTVVYKPNNVFVEEGVVVRSAVINGENGPVFLAKNAQVLEGAVIYGPAFIGENTIIGANSRLLGGTYIGKNCVIGGEVKRSYIQANSNKSHEGYMGDSIIGEWCNLGAGTNISNLKNNFGNIKLWSYSKSEVQNSSRWKAGVLMGDYCKTAIGSRINSGTTMGVGTVIFSPELTDKFYSNFSWGEERYDFHKFIITARKMWEMNGCKNTGELEVKLNTLYLIS